MRAYASKLNKNSESYATNRAEMLALVDELHALKDRAKQLSERRRPRFVERGQLTPRERLATLLDPGMPFLELYGLANYMVDVADREKSVPGASALSGIGFVNGVRCMIYASDSGIAAGAMMQKTGEKLRGCLDTALALNLPFIHLVESAGANLMKYQVEGWAHGGGAFFRLAKLSGAGVPTFVVLHGPSTAGGAYFPGMSDYVIGIKGRGRASLGGAALVRAATGEISDEEELAGAEMHATTTGSVEYLAEDDAHGLLMARDVIGGLGWNDRCPKPDRAPYKEPLLDPEDFKPRYGPSVVCLQAKIFGQAVGIVGNNGPIDPNGATKAAHFFQLCDQAGMPLIMLNNITGYMVGKDYEQAGMIKHGSKMIQAISNVRVPKITFYIGASFGAGNYGMGGLAYEPDFLFAWPNASTGVMGGEQAASTMDQVARDGAKRKGEEADEDALALQKQRLTDHFDSQSDAFYTSGRVLDQGVIDPRDTRKVIGFALETCWEARNRDLAPNAFGVARM
jgi:geranyl-CoA carboxylase beta subunit